ncbi:hypothetical protein GHNINEIG_00088 [Hydrogenovibrio crunogenus]|uniref:Polysaccharide biosynthesis protein n=1 Tax=Hydrogenovibrio crunogenus TaxID=39765 RepID=A0A4V1C8I9_9GAMM|nr:hypothetical protein [Hydrogenovibrio crunogenus]QBZ82064.1 hypothetical protein GHNINEIG_00088 [Hydrogenovibrio crunogenus]RUM91879.1 MAG: hypothetical protein DSZ27_04995 [Thiomicrospira sp.]
MEIGSPLHRHLLMKGILRTALKTASLGVIIGLMLIFPRIIRENTFSTGLSYAGQSIILISFIYSLVIAIKKYRKTIGSLDT